MKGYQKVFQWFKGTDTLDNTKFFEEKHADFNPLQLSVDDMVTIDEIDFNDERYRVREVNYLEVPLNDKTYWITDYTLGENNNYKLRAIHDEVDGCRVLLLNLDDEFEYSADFQYVVNDDSKEFVITDEGGEEIHFWRVNDVGIPYAAKSTNLNKSMLYWDFSCNKELDGVEVEEFVLVEIENKNGWTQIWRGMEINRNDISLF